MSTTTFRIVPGAIEEYGSTLSLDFSSPAFSDGSSAHPSYDESGETTGNDSFELDAPQSPDSSTAPYSVTWGDATQVDELSALTINYDNATVTQAPGASQLIVDDSIVVNAGTLDLGDSGDVSFAQASGTFILNGVLKGSGAIDYGGPAVTGSGTIIAVAYDDNRTLQFASAVDSGISAKVESGANLDFGSVVQSGVTVMLADSSNGIISIDDVADFAGTVDGLAVGPGAANPGGYIDLTELAASSIVSTSIINNTITLVGSIGVLGTIALGGADYSGKHADWTTDGASGTALHLADAVCFVAGTRILTPRGSVPVETIAAGDEVITIVDGERLPQPVKWVGYRKLDLARQKNRRNLAPVRFKQGSMGENLPEQDLLVSPPHCMFMDGKLIPAKLLINNMTIFQDAELEAVEYYHLELNRHCVVIAEGVETESYLDTGNRAFFNNAGLALMLHPEFHVNAGLRCWETDACAPLAVGPNAVFPAWQALASRAQELGYLTQNCLTTRDADVHLLVDGRRVDSISVKGQVHTFVVPAGSNNVVLASRSAVPSDLVPYLDDPREIGVAIRKLVVRGVARHQEFSADHPALALGWHAPEFEKGTVWRWSSGRGELPMDTKEGPAVVELVICATAEYRMEPEMGGRKNGSRLAA